MMDEIVAIARRQATKAVRRAAVPAALGLAVAIFFLFTVAGLFVALFFWLAPAHGPLAASLIVSAVAFVLGLLALLPFAFKRSPPPPPQPDATLPQLVSLVARSTPGHPPRQLILTAVLLAIAVGFAARGSPDGKT
jgi:hypothetical protein